MKLSEWARINGVSRQTAARWFHAGILPVPARQLATGTILVDGPAQAASGVAIYARVSSGDQRADLDRQVARLVEHATGAGLAPTRVVSEVGSGLDGRRTKLLGLLRDAGVGTIVVEHRDCGESPAWKSALPALDGVGGGLGVAGKEPELSMPGPGRAGAHVVGLRTCLRGPHRADASAQGRRPDGASRRVMIPTIAHLTIASEVAMRRS